MAERKLWEEREWTNPLATHSRKPFLNDLVFPEDCDSPAQKDSVVVLKRFYSKARESYQSDVEQFNAYLASSGAQLFIIEGDVGVGKTWFVRYHLMVEPPAQNAQANGFGVIDMLRASGDQPGKSFYRQLCPILAAYYRKFFGSVEDALRRFAAAKYGSRRPTGKHVPPAKQIREGGKALLTKWLALDDGEDLGGIMLSALEHLAGPILFLAIDNLDRASEKDQSMLLEMAQKRLKNASIRLIVPLRRSSTLLRDRFGKVPQVSLDEMRLSPLKMQAMLARRFEYTRHGAPLILEPSVVENGETWTYARLFKMIFAGNAGSLLEAISGGDCRVALRLTKRLLKSTNILRLGNIGSSSAAIPAWMAGPNYEPDDAAPLLNLFDNERMTEPGNTLIRYRLLEYLVREGTIDPLDNHMNKYFARLGYTETRVRDVLSRFLMAAMVASDRGLTPDKLAELPAEGVGTLRITKTGRAHFHELLDCEWYYISARRAMVKRLPARVVDKDKHAGHSYVTHTAFVEYLRDEEQAELTRIRVWEGLHGTELKRTHLTPPHVKAQSKLMKKEKRGE